MPSLGTSAAISNSQIASTLAHHRRNIADNVTDATPVLSFLMGEMGRSMRAARGFGESLPGTFVGGRDIEVPVQLVASQSLGAYSGRDTLDVSEQDSDRFARFPIKQNFASVSISGREKRANKGDAALYNLLESKVSRMQADFRMDLNRQVLSDGTGASGKEIGGLAAVVGTGTLGQLNPSTYTLWQPGGVASGGSRHGVNASVGSFASGGLAEMRTRWRNLSQGQDQPDAILSAKDAAGYFETALTASGNGQIQYETFEFGETGFRALRFKGAPLFEDFAIADGYMYYMNSGYIMFMRDSEGDFTWLDGENNFVRPPDQDAFVATMIVEGNVITNNRRFLGESSGITA